LIFIECVGLHFQLFVYHSISFVYTLHHETQYTSSVGQTFITWWYIYNVAFVLFWNFVVHSFCACNKL